MLPGGSDNVRGPPAVGSAAPIAALYGGGLYVMKLSWDYVARTAVMYGATNPWRVLVAPFTRLCSNIGPCVVQPDTIRRLDAISERLMNRLVYNNFGAYDSVRALSCC